MIHQINLNFIFYRILIVFLLIQTVHSTFPVNNSLSITSLFLNKQTKPNRVDTITAKIITTAAAAATIATTTTTSADTSTTKRTKCTTTSKSKLNFFDEIHMADTLEELKYSCASLFYSNYSQAKVTSNKIYSSSCSSNNKHSTLLDSIIVDIVDRVLSIDDLEALKSICTDDDETKRFKNADNNNKFNINTFEHDLCGNIFKNSYSKSYFKRYLSSFIDYEKYLSVPINSDSDFEDDDIDREMKSYHFLNKNNSNLTVIDAIKSLNNCTLVLLKKFFAAQSAKCEYIKFVDLIDHYDCVTTNFSVKSNCDMCRVSILFFLLLTLLHIYSYFSFQKAYKNWLCSNKIPYFQNDTFIKPCQNLCSDVQNLCPFFRPIEDIYAGQPVFHCNNIIDTVYSCKY